MKERLLFAGTPHFSATILHALLEAQFNIIGVLTQTDKPKGRGLQVCASPVKQLALEHQLPVFQPSTLKDPELIATLAALQPTRLIVVAYGLLLPKAVLELPPKGCLNVHTSLLPRFRGASPIVHALLAGDTETGITLIQMDQGLDTGPILAKAPYLIQPKETLGSLEASLATLGATLLIEYLRQSTPPPPIPQDHALACYAPKIHKEHTIIHWKQPAITIERQIRAFYPHPGAITFFQGIPVKILAATLSPTPTQAPPGMLLTLSSDHIAVATGDGILQIEALQWPARKPARINDLMRTQTLPKQIQEGMIFG